MNNLNDRDEVSIREAPKINDPSLSGRENQDCIKTMPMKKSKVHFQAFLIQSWQLHRIRRGAIIATSHGYG